MSDVILAQLLAIRAQVDATIALVEATVRPITPEVFDGPRPLGALDDAPPGCPHPPERQRDASTFGNPGQVVCLDCNWKRPGRVDA